MKSNEVYLARGAILKTSHGSKYMLTQVFNEEYYLINIDNGNRWSEEPIKNIVKILVDEDNKKFIRGKVEELTAASEYIDVVRLDSIHEQYYFFDDVAAIYNSTQDLIKPKENIIKYENKIEIDEEMLELLILKGLASGENYSILSRAKQIRSLLIDNKEKFLK